MWETWRISKEYRCLPSDLLSITESTKKFYFNRAVWRFGISLEAEMDQAESQAKTDAAKRSARMLVFNRYMNPDNPNKGRFRDPAKKWGQ